MAARQATVLVGMLVMVLLAGCAGTGEPSDPLGASPTLPVASSSTPTSSSSTALPTYVFASGDTLATIASKFGLTVKELLAANPSISDPNKITVGHVLVIPRSTLGTVIRIEGPDYVHPRIDEMPTLVLIADPGLAGEPVEWQLSRSGGATWEPYGNEVIDSAGQAQKQAVDPELTRQLFRARVPASATHPELWTQTVTLEWGGDGPCPARRLSYPPPTAIAADGTTYQLLPGMDQAYNSQWSITGGTAAGTPGPAWTHQLEPCWEPGWEMLVDRDGTAFITVGYEASPAPGAGPTPHELIIAGPEGIRAQMPLQWGLELAPGGIVFGHRTEADEEGPYEPTFRSLTVAALGRDGLPRPGWPFTTTDPSSYPVFGPDGTVYLAQSSESGDRVIALGLDGRVKAGWPYEVPGELESTACGDGCADVPESPGIGPDGSVVITLGTGIYLVRPDGTTEPGWPYLLPEGTSIPNAAPTDTPGGGMFKALLTDDGRIYLPRLDERYADAHHDLMCLLPDGSLCPGWPVRMPFPIDNIWLDEEGALVATLIAGDYTWPQVSLLPDGTIVERETPGD